MPEENLSRLGQNHLTAGEYSKAIEVLTRALKINPKNVNDLYHLGIAHYYLRNHDKTIEFCKKVLEIDSNHNYALSTLGSVYQRTKEYTKAIDVCKKALEIDPDDYITWGTLGGSYELNGEHEKAIEAYKKSLEISPKYIKSSWSLCKIYYDIKEYEKALELCMIVEESMANDEKLSEIKDWGDDLLEEVLQLKTDIMVIVGDKEISKDQKKDIIIFLSYSQKDSEFYQVPKIALTLKEDPHIKDVMFYEGVNYHSVVDYMSENIHKCDVFLSFCSQNALKSRYIKDEWQSAYSEEKKIVPVFTDYNDVPTLIKPYLGVQFNKNDIDTSIREIRSVIFKVLGSK